MTLECNTSLFPLCILRPDVPLWTLVPTHSHTSGTPGYSWILNCPQNGVLRQFLLPLCEMACPPIPLPPLIKAFLRLDLGNWLGTACRFLSLLSPAARLPHPRHCQALPFADQLSTEVLSLWAPCSHLSPLYLTLHTQLPCPPPCNGLNAHTHCRHKCQTVCFPTPKLFLHVC